MIKNLIYILIFCLICTNAAFAQVQETGLEYNSYKYSFKIGDNIIFKNQADENLRLSESTTNTATKIQYLQQAMRYYYLLSQIQPSSVDAQVGLGRVYDEMKLDKFAKKHFFNAINFSKNNAKANFYFANFYYKRHDLINAMKYYKIAYSNGYSDNFEINNIMGTIYEKLGDINSAQKFYTAAYNIDKNDYKLYSKLIELDELNYSQSQYYLFLR